MYLPQLETLLKRFALAHRDKPVSKRFSTLITGGSGIGKTDLIKQIATDLDMGVVIVHVAQLEPGDLLGIPRSKPFFLHPLVESAFQKAEQAKGLGKLVSLSRSVFDLFFESERYTVYDLPSYLPHTLGNETWVDEDGIERPFFNIDLLGSKLKNRKQLAEKLGSDWKKRVKGFVLFFDEINRAANDDTKGAIFELPGDYALHHYEVPPHCVIFAAANPSTERYQVNDMDSDAAWTGRFVNLKAQGQISSSLAYFRGQGFHDSIVSFIEANPEALMEPEPAFELKVARSARSYERINVIHQYVDLPEDDAILRELFMGILGEDFGSTYTNHLYTSLEIPPSGADIVLDYGAHRARLQQAVEANDTSFIHQVLNNLYRLFMDEDAFHARFWVYATPDEYRDFRRGLIDADHVQRTLVPEALAHTEQFLADLTAEVRMSFIKQVIFEDHINDALCHSALIHEAMLQDTDEVFDSSWLQPPAP